MRVASIENDPQLVAMLRRQFASRKWAFAATDGQNLFEFLETVRPTVLTVDWNLDGRCGLSLVEQIRRSPFRELPILVLTGRVSEKDVEEALSRGADDFLKKPFSFVELCARLLSLKRRASGVFSTYSDRRTKIDFEKLVLTVNGVAVSIGPQEWRVLEALARSPFALTRSEIITRAWGAEAQVLPDAVDKTVSRLRIAFSQACDVHEYIASVRGVGYKFNHNLS